MDVDELIRRFAVGERDFSGADLKGTKLSGIDLSCGNDRDAAILNADNLAGAERTSLIVHVDLSGADLSGADLSGADLSGVCLRGANLSNANLRRAQLRDANLEDAIFCKTTMPDGSIRNDGCGGENADDSPAKANSSVSLSEEVGSPTSSDSNPTVDLNEL
jgi:uncharacterized protein YjbI with pentapeptide repeats